MPSIAWTITRPASSIRNQVDHAADPIGVDVLWQGEAALDGRGDYLSIDGEALVEQAVNHVLATSPGEFKLRPQYGAGVPAFLKKPGNKSRIDELKHRILDALSRVRRIEKVLGCEVAPGIVDNVNAIVIQLTVRIAGRTLRLRPLTFKEAS